MLKNLEKRILLSITGKTRKEFYDKMDEIAKLKLDNVALFVECYHNKKFRAKMYELLLQSSVRKIPLVHICDEVTVDELVFLEENFGTKYFTIHESHFKNLKRWKGFYRKLFLEMNYNNYVSGKIDVSMVGGFCVDLSHFKSAEARGAKEFDYEIRRKSYSRYFKCNHLNGYSWKRKKDIHVIKNFKEFDYLKTLPTFIFGECIAIETFNSIKDQIRFKKYVVRILQNKQQ